MGKLALSDRVLLSVEKPARYIGEEMNIVKKDPSSVAIRFCMCFPDVYEIGMSHLGIQILYDMMNRREDTWCERVYSPWTDLDAIMRKEHIPLFALESQDPVKEFDFLGITLQYEMCYTNICQILDLSGIPMSAADRTEADPLVIGGGPCAYNPEPIADFFDLFYIGEGETQYDTLFDLYKANRSAGGSRMDFLKKAAGVPGIYVPQLYAPAYHEDGTLAAFSPLVPEAPAVIRKEAVSDLTHACYPEKPLVPYTRATQDRVMLEIQRGCIRGCRFCQAGMIYRPLREKSVESLEAAAGKMLDSTGYDEINLSSLSSSDYRELGELVNYLVDHYGCKGVNISLPSLRIDSFSLDVMSKIQDIKKSSVTFAPEAGTQRMRDVINKGLTEEEILNGSRLAFEAGWNRVKLYFMLGQPTETPDDVAGIAHLANEIARTYYFMPSEYRHGRISITVSTSFFVPKPFTPFQWVRMDTQAEYLEKVHHLQNCFRKETNARSIKYNYHDSYVSVLEGVLARGDRRLSAVILDAYRNGCMFDAWTECFHPEGWTAAFEKNHIDPAFYTGRTRTEEELLPWDFISCGVSRSFLWSEYQKALAGIVTPNCREHCSGCGAACISGGVCHESKS